MIKTISTLSSFRGPAVASKADTLEGNKERAAAAVPSAVAPLIKAGLVSPDSVIADTKSGLSGGGRAPSLERHFSEANEGMGMGSVSGHNQKPISMKIQKQK